MLNLSKANGAYPVDTLMKMKTLLMRWFAKRKKKLDLISGQSSSHISMKSFPNAIGMRLSWSSPEKERGSLQHKRGK